MTGNKKRIVCGALLCVMALGMTACGNEIPDLTEAESQRVGEYAAVTLLKYDANHRSRLVDPEIVIAKLEKDAARETGRQENAQTEEKPAESTASEAQAPTAQEDITTSLEDFFGLAEGVTLTTMLPNDMSTYVETMAPGETQGLVLLLEVNEDMANGIQNISLRLKNTSNEYTIQLL